MIPVPTDSVLLPERLECNDYSSLHPCPFGVLYMDLSRVMSVHGFVLPGGIPFERLIVLLLRQTIVFFRIHHPSLVYMYYTGYFFNCIIFFMHTNSIFYYFISCFDGRNEIPF